MGVSRLHKGLQKLVFIVVLVLLHIFGKLCQSLGGTDNLELSMVTDRFDILDSGLFIDHLNTLVKSRLLLSAIGDALQIQTVTGLVDWGRPDTIYFPVYRVIRLDAGAEGLGELLLEDTGAVVGVRGLGEIMIILQEVGDSDLLTALVADVLHLAVDVVDQAN